jgi:hypothetical protein
MREGRAPGWRILVTVSQARRRGPGASALPPGLSGPRSARAGPRHAMAQADQAHTSRIRATAYNRLIGSVQQRSTATRTETSRLRRTSMDGQQDLECEFSNVGSMCLQDGMQKVRARGAIHCRIRLYLRSRAAPLRGAAGSASAPRSGLGEAPRGARRARL